MSMGDKTPISYVGQTVEVVIDRQLHSKHPKWGFEYEANYGYVPNTMSGDGEELDAYVLNVDKPVEKFTGRCVAVIHRTNDNDDKLVIIPSDQNDISDEDIRKQTEFQEKFFKSVILRSGKTFGA